MMGRSLELDHRFRVAINAQIVPGGSGGVESALIGLVHALGRLDDGPEEYVIIGPAENREWLKPYMGANQRIILTWVDLFPVGLCWLDSATHRLCLSLRNRAAQCLLLLSTARVLTRPTFPS